MLLVAAPAELVKVRDANGVVLRGHQRLDERLCPDSPCMFPAGTHHELRHRRDLACLERIGRVSGLDLGEQSRGGCGVAHKADELLVARRVRESRLVLGLPLGILLCTSDKATGLRPHKALNQILSVIINILRAIPFVILVILLFPVTRAIVHTAIGTKASIVPLTIAAAPFVARVIESSLKEVDPGVIAAGRSMGSTDRQLIFKILLPEALPSIVNGVTLTIINLIGYSAMAGTVGGGGLGDVAIRYGYQRYRIEYMVGSVVIILLMVEIIQVIGSHISNKMQAMR